MLCLKGLQYTNKKENLKSRDGNCQDQEEIYIKIKTINLL